MGLRFLLVVVVFGLGVDLPSGEALSSWARAGSDWVQSRLNDVLDREALAEAKPPEDSDFEAIVDGMANAFAIDLATAEHPLSRPVVLAEAIEAPEDVEPGIAYALNRGSQGEGLSPEIVPTEASKGPESQMVGAARASQIASAVRLTRQAASAWWIVVRGTEATASAW